MKIGRLLVRLVVGGLFIGHGTQELFRGPMGESGVQPGGGLSGLRPR
jgi:uncharacterized membrane protein YphA (DoxX/SURF4 family)